MKQIYIILLFFLPFYSYSQLYISPQKDKESYMYVRGDVLYVEQNIDLQRNPGDLASLYLRDEAQLLQGPLNSNNSGNGTISVFQEGKANVYTYNYWSSPVENTTGNTSFGSIIYEPSTPIRSDKAHITSALNGHARPLTISNRWIYKLRGNSYSDWEYIGNNFDIAPGEGFTMKGVEGTNTQTVIYGVPNNPGNEQRYDFRGRPHTGIISVPVETATPKLIGNPYPSALDLNAFLLENRDITGIAYFWDSKPVHSHFLTDYEGGYGAYSPVLGIFGYVPAAFLKYDSSGNPVGEAGTGGYYARRYSPIAQGFIVEGLRDGNVIFRNKYRQFIKENFLTSQFKASSIDEENAFTGVRINFDFNDTFIRQLLLAFHPDATRGVDRAMDARNLSYLATDAGWKIEDKNYIINVRPLEKLDVIPVTLTLDDASIVAIKLAGNYNFDEELFLYDNLTNTYQSLKEGARLSLQNGEYNDRFYITFSNKWLDLNTEVLDEEYIVVQNNSMRRAEISSLSTTSPKEISLFDLTGKLILTHPGEENRFYYELSTGNFSKGMYIIKINTAEGSVVSKKIIISN